MAEEDIKTDEADKSGEEWDIKRQLRDTTKAFQEKESKYIELLETRDAELQRLTDTVQQFVTSTQAKDAPPQISESEKLMEQVKGLREQILNDDSDFEDKATALANGLDTVATFLSQSTSNSKVDQLMEKMASIEGVLSQQAQSAADKALFNKIDSEFGAEHRSTIVEKAKASLGDVDLSTLPAVAQEQLLRAAGREVLSSVDTPATETFEPKQAMSPNGDPPAVPKAQAIMSKGQISLNDVHSLKDLL